MNFNQLSIIVHIEILPLIFNNMNKFCMFLKYFCDSFYEKMNQK